MLRYWIRVRIARKREAVSRWIAWHLPQEVVTWAAVRVGAHATTGKYGSTLVPEMTFMDALGRWINEDRIASH